jgi:ABC-2 type transport system ATP-binding protein
MKGSVLSIEGLTVAFGDFLALDRVNLQASEGEFVIIVGPDGAGKSTLMQAICGLVKKRAGVVRVLENEIPKDFSKVKQHIGLLPQKFSLYQDLTVEENIMFFARAFQINDYMRDMNQLLEASGLAPFKRRLAQDLSGGMKQKLALCCTLIHKPRLLLLDEPTAGVDPVSRREFLDILVELFEGGMTVLMSTPYMDEAMRGQRTVFLHNGKVVADASPDALLSSVRARPIEIVAQDIQEIYGFLANNAKISHARLVGNRILLWADMTKEALEKMLVSGGFSSFSCRQTAPNLEDVFIQMTEANDNG